MESQPAPLLSRQSKILKVVSDFKYLVSWANSTEKGIEVRKSLAWKALNDMSSIWSSNLSRDLKIRVFQATIESVLYFMAARDGHLLSQWKSPSIGTTPACLPMSLATVGETESPTPNFTATFQLCQRGSDSERLVLLAIATVTANCQQASLSCGGRPTHGHLRRDCPESTFIDTLILSIIIERYYRLYLLHWSGASVNESGSNQITRKARLSVFSFSFSFLFTLYTLFTLIKDKNIEKITSIIRIFNKIHLTLPNLLVFACYVVIFPIRFDLSYFL